MFQYQNISKTQKFNNFSIMKSYNCLQDQSTVRKSQTIKNNMYINVGILCLKI